ncbi:MAG: ATP-dependent helicase [Actinobacteria bacterium]|nr:ATP-dependent helicase [Actinomycetota bacterium]
MTFPDEPSPEQRRILDLGLASIKVSAGAGTGKTTTVAMIIANVIATAGVEPEQVLGITFTNKAASELADRVRQATGRADPSRQVEVHTYHGFAAQVLSEFGPLAGVDGRVRVITPTFSRQLMSETFHRLEYRRLDMTNSRALDRIKRLGDRLGDHLLTPAALLTADPVDEVEEARQEMARTLSVYETEKRRLGLVDYADLVTLSTKIMTAHPELARVVRDRYRVVVLDEYQDTNPAQRALLTAIFDDGFPVIAVGDEEQTIYEWRGASTENFEMFQTHFPQPDGRPAHLMTLTLNRRSTTTILVVANEVRERAGEGADPLVSALPPDPNSEVVTYWAGDAIEEAEWIARKFEQLHDAGTPWREMAVLFRKNKDFAMVVDVFGRHEIPLEVANIGGLLSVPEVAELRAWLTILERPDDGAALVQILFGSRYRLGLADLAPLVRLAGGSDSDDPEPVTLVETIERLEETTGLRPAAHQALTHFAAVYRRLLLESQGLALVDVCRLILEATGAWRDVEALPPNPRLTARLNLYRLLDLAEDWSPLKGRPSVQAFLEYLDVMQDEPADEIDAARLSGEDAVTLVTVHRAKGLEWDNVAIPAVTRENFPSKAAEFPNPWRVPDQIPATLRIDDVLAELPRDEEPARDFLRARHWRQEWRVAYVAVTRARRRLFVSGAYWYGLGEALKRPKEPSELWDLVDGLDVARCERRADPVPRPLVLRLDTETTFPDPHFPDGWAATLRAGVEDPRHISEVATRLHLGDEVAAMVDGFEGRLFALEPVPGMERTPQPPDVVSVTGLVTYARCPRQYFWTTVDPLPRRHNPAATQGTEVHRRIEMHQRGQVPLEGEAPDPFRDTETWSPGAYQTYLTSRFASKTATLVECSFELGTGAVLRLRGRVDAIYTDGANWEVVDFKSGLPDDDPARLVQLQCYAMAAHDHDFGLDPPQTLRVTFAYLGGRVEEVSYHADETWMMTARETVRGLANGVAEGRYEERPGPWCAGCDFLRFCAPGRAFLG